MKKSIQYWLAACIISLPPITVFLFISFYSINIPYMDQWDGFVEIISSINNGTFSFIDLWKQHNEHRLIFPKLVMISLALLSHWNVIWEQYFSFFIQACTFLILLSLLKDTISFRQSYLHILLKIIISIFLFSMVQYENWSWGWQIQVFLNIFAVTFTVWAIAKFPYRWAGFFIGILGAIVATYSFANGMLIWVLVFLWMLSSNYKKRIPFILIWILAASGTLFSYIYNYEKPIHHPSLLSFLENPLNFLAFFFSYIGSPFGMFFNLSGSILFGILGVCIFLYFIISAFIYGHNDILKKYLPWIVIILYILSSAMLTAIGRSGFSAKQSLYSRYTSFSLLFWVALFAMVLPYIEYLYHHNKFFSPRTVYSVFAGLFFILIFSHSLSYTQGVVSFKNHFAHLSHIHSLLKYKRIYGSLENFAILHPSMTELFKSIKILRQLKMGAFYSEIPKPGGIYIQGSYLFTTKSGSTHSLSEDNILILEKDRKVSLKVDIPDTADYKFSAEVGFSSDNGVIVILIDGITIGKTDCRNLDANKDYIFLRWIDYGIIFLSKGEHRITIKSMNAPNILNAIAIKNKIKT